MAEKNGLVNLELAEEFGQNDFGFVVHEIDGALFREALRFAVAVARINQDAAAGSLGKLFGKILPHGDGAEAFMKHDDSRRVCGRREQQSLEAFAVDYNFPIILRQLGQLGALDSESD